MPDLSTVRVDDGLRVRRRSGGVDHHHQVGGSDFGFDPLEDLVADVAVVGQVCEIRGGGRPGPIGPTDQPDAAQVGGFGQVEIAARGMSEFGPRHLELLLEVLSEQGPRRDERVQVRMADCARQLGRAQERAQQHGDATDAGDGEQRGDEVGTLGEEHADARPLADAGLQQSFGQPAGVLLGRLEGQPLVAA